MMRNLTACIFLRLIVVVGILFLAGCFEDVVSEKLVLEFKPEDNAVVATLSSTITVDEENLKNNRPLRTRVETYRSEFADGRDAWSRRFASVSPLRREYRAWDKDFDHLKHSEHAGEFLGNDLQQFFADTGLIVSVLRGNGWDELAIYPGTSTRATQQQRLRVQSALDNWSYNIAEYLRVLEVLYRYIELHPDRAAATLGALLKDFLPEEKKNALEPMTEDETDLVTIVDEAMGKVTPILWVVEDEAYSLNELSALVYDPFPAELVIRLPGPVLESQGFIREQDSSVRVEPLALWNALDGLEAAWITPDPLVSSVSASRKGGQVDLNAFLAEERRINKVPSPASVRTAIEARLARASVYRVRWTVARRGEMEPRRRGDH